MGMKFLNSKLRSFNLYFNSKKKLYCFANNNILNIIDLNAKIKSTKKK